MDVIENTLLTIKRLRIRGLKRLHGSKAKIIVFSRKGEQYRTELRKFLSQSLYRHPRVLKMTERGKKVVKRLFRASLGDSSILSEEIRVREKIEGRERAICDYLAGMTDRFAMEKYALLTKRKTQIAQKV